MAQQHKHAAIIKAWADGQSIQCRCHGFRDWSDYPESPGLNWCRIGDVAYEWRIKPVPHKWQKEMDAAKEGKTIQFRHAGTRQWVDAVNSSGLHFWECGVEYRIKPEEMTYICQVVVTAPYSPRIRASHQGHVNIHSATWEENLKLTFEDGKLVKAEVL